MKIALVTAMTGGYDEIRQKQPIPDVDMYAFTDTPSSFTKAWNVIKLDKTNKPRLQARKVKARLLEYVPDGYDYVVWCDATFQAREYFYEKIIKYATFNDFTLCTHTVRRTLQQEIDFLIEINKYPNELAKMHQRAYINDGCPTEEVPIYSTGFNVRKNTNKNRQMGKLWYDVCRKFGPLDQIALSYALWKKQIEPATVPETSADNRFVTLKYFHKVPHQDQVE